METEVLKLYVERLNKLITKARKLEEKQVSEADKAKQAEKASSEITEDERLAQKKLAEEAKQELDKEKNAWLLECKLVLEMTVPEAAKTLDEIIAKYDNMERKIEPELVAQVLTFARDILCSKDLQSALTDTDRRLTNIISNRFFHSRLFHIQAAIILLMASFAFYGYFQVRDVKFDINKQMSAELTRVKDQADSVESNIKKKSQQVEGELKATVATANETREKLLALVADNDRRLNDIQSRITKMEEKISDAILEISKKHSGKVIEAGKQWMEGQLKIPVKKAQQTLAKRLKNQSDKIVADSLLETGQLQNSVETLSKNAGELDAKLGSVDDKRKELQSQIEELHGLLKEAKGIAEDKGLIQKIDKISTNKFFAVYRKWIDIGAYVIGGLAFFFAFYQARETRLQRICKGN